MGEQADHLIDFDDMSPGGCEIGELLRAAAVSLKIGRHFAAEAVVEQMRVLRRQQPPSLAPANVHRPAIANDFQIGLRTKKLMKADI